MVTITMLDQSKYWLVIFILPRDDRVIQGQQGNYKAAA